MLEFAVLVLFTASFGLPLRALSLAWRGQYVSAAELARRPPESDVLLEEWVSDSNVSRYQGLVAYKWASAAHLLQPRQRLDTIEHWGGEKDAGGEITIDLPDGPVRAVRGEHLPKVGLSGRLHILCAAQNEVPQRYSGLRKGDPVLVFGSRGADAQVVLVRAEQIFVGDRAAFVANQLDRLGVMAVCGALFLLLCPLVGLYAARRLWTEAAD